ncbi:PKD domain-containing protein [Candidatus Bipolaricaulota bacterium]|nr:PKD domain-containing protein [Candidatus Bipolaricaulota bacterium]
MRTKSQIIKIIPVAFLILLVGVTWELGVAAQTIEVGKVSIDENWETVRLNNSFRNPVVVAKPLSYNGADPAVVRIQNVGANSFQIRVQEWGYLDETHTEETVSYLATERGRFLLRSGMRVEAGRIKTDATGNFKRIRFSTSFRQTPAVFSSILTFNGEQPAVTRNQNVNRSGFEIMMQEEEAHEQKHAEEVISYIAIEPGSGTIGGRRFEVGRVPGIDENFRRLKFGFGDNTTIKVDEETSADSEKSHAAEEVGYFAVQGGPRYFIADMQTTNGGNTANLRYGGKVDSGEPEKKNGGREQPPSRGMPRGIIIEPPSQSRLDISVRTDRYQYSIGSNLRIFLDVSQRAYVYIFDYDTSGETRLVFPNRYSRQNLIGPGRYELPDGGYNFRVTGPPGVEFVQAIATTKKVEVNRLLKNPSNPFGQDVYPPVADPQKLNQEFRSSLKAKFELQFGGDEPKAQFKIVPVSWNSDTTSFRVGAITQPNETPVARFDYNPADPRTGELVSFSALGSYDPDGSIVSYNWDLNGDGRTDASGRRISHRYYSTGRYDVRLTVRDNDGATSTSRKTIRVGKENQSPIARISYDPGQPEPDETVRFDGSSSSDNDGNIVSHRWDFDGDGFTDAYGRRVTHSFRSSGSYDVSLTVVDDDGGRSSTTRTIRVVSPKGVFGSERPDSFFSNGVTENDWYWLKKSDHYGEWEWNRLSSSPGKAFINFDFLVTNSENGGSGYGTTVKIQILTRFGNVSESGEVKLRNPFQPVFSGDTEGAGYQASGHYEVSNPSNLRNGFRVRVKWPPADSRNLVAIQRDSALLAYMN